MLTYHIFLASSNELEQDRITFGDIVQELNDSLAARDMKVGFRLYKWERDTASFAERRKQDEYNKEIGQCSVFVLLYASKLGMFTSEEYEFAYNRFKNEDTPYIYVYKKQGIPAIDDSVTVFEKRVAENDQQYKSEYSNTVSLRNSFITEMEKLFAKGKLKKGVPARTLYSDGHGVPAFFIGREEELKHIRNKLELGGRLMLINAEGGLGKTSVAARYWQQSQYDYAFNAWLFCESGIINQIKKLAPELNIDLQDLSEDDQIVALKSALQNISHSFLLVLDNANDPEEIIAFKDAFRGLHWHVLITSRSRGVLESEYEYPITHLPPPQAKELFLHNYSEEGPAFNTLLDRVLEALYYHTLLIELFSKNMRHLKERGERLSDFLQHLETQGLFLDKRSFFINTDYTSNRHIKPGNSDEIIDRLYNFAELKLIERHWLVNISLLPAVSYNFVFLCELFKQDKFEFKMLHQLAQKGWLVHDDKGFRISPVVQKIVLKKNEGTLLSDSSILLHNLNERLENDSVHLKYFNEARPYVELAATITKHLIKHPNYALSLLNYNTCIYFISVGKLDRAFEAGQADLAINERLGDKHAMAHSHSILGKIYQRQGKLEEALVHFQHSLDLSRALHNEKPKEFYFRRSLSVALSSIGNIYEIQGDLENALVNYQEFLRISESLDEEQSEAPDPSVIKNIATAHLVIGGILDKQQKEKETIHHYQQCLDITISLIEEYPQDASVKRILSAVYSRFGDFYKREQELQKALSYYELCLNTSLLLCQTNPGGISFKDDLANALVQTGEIKQMLGKKQDALDNFRKARQLWKELIEDCPSFDKFKNNYLYIESLLDEITKEDA